MTVPTSVRAFLGFFVTSTPFRYASPDVAFIKWVRILSVVLFPAPLGPSSPVKLFFLIVRFRSFTAVNLPYSFLRFTISMGLSVMLSLF